MQYPVLVLYIRVYGSDCHLCYVFVHGVILRMRIRCTLLGCRGCYIPVGFVLELICYYYDKSV
jgi:hypothetical protein